MHQSFSVRRPPDSGNSEILAHYGTPELKERYLEPLLDNRIISCFSMTEPQGGADPKIFETTAVQDGDHWVINGEKWYSSFASKASFIIVMTMTDPDAAPYERYSMFVLPGGTPGINVLRDVGLGYQPLGGGGREGTCAMRTFGCRPIICSARAAAPSWWHRLAWAAAGFIMRCGPSAWCGGYST